MQRASKPKIVVPTANQAEEILKMRAALFVDELEQAGVNIDDVRRHVAPWSTPKRVAAYRDTVERWLCDSYVFLRVVCGPEHEILGLFAANIAKPAQPTHYVITIQLHPSIRRQGVGSQLFAEFRGTLDNLKPITLHVAERNMPAIQFYTHLGFSATGATRTDVIGAIDGRPGSTVQSLELILRQR